MTDTQHKLYVVATPIGHRDDFSLRAIDVLQRCCCIYAEDTRHSRPLLLHHGIATHVVSLHEHNEAAKIDAVLSQLRNNGSVALISDAGTPLISDPGYRLVRACQEAGFDVSPIPGPSALTAALSVAGQATDRFVFAGFPPSKSQARLTWFRELAELHSTLIVYESPHRITATLADIVSVFGSQRDMTLARELTKRYETVKRGSAAEIQAFVLNDAQQQRGEFVLIMAGVDKQEKGTHTDQNLKAMMITLLKHMPVKTAAKVAAELTGVPRKQAYELGVQVTGE